MITALFSVMLLADAHAAHSTSTESAAAATQAVEAPKEERKVCKREPIPGSQYGSKRVCLTASEWKARNRGGADLDGVDTKSRSNPYGG